MSCAWAPEKAADGFPPLLAVIERPVIDVHAHELVGQLRAPYPAHIAARAHRLRPMLEAVIGCWRVKMSEIACARLGANRL